MTEKAIECGPVAATWFGTGLWPTCACGLDPRDNQVLNKHWADAGFEVVDNHGQLTVRSLIPLEPSQFPSAYKARMIQAYPVIAGMGADQFFHATAGERETAFIRILSARNLRRTHELYLESGDG